MVTNMTKAIQQIMLGTVTKNEKQAAESLKTCYSLFSIKSSTFVLIN